MQEVSSQEEFESVISSSKKVFVFCYGNSCGRCKRIAPRLEQLANSYDYRKIVFIKLNLDTIDNFSRKYILSPMYPFSLYCKTGGPDDPSYKCSASSLPTFLFFKEGKLTDSIVSADINKIKDGLYKLL